MAAASAALSTPAAQVLIQLVVGGAVVVALYYLSLWVLRRDNLVVDVTKNTDPKQRTLVVDGFIDASNLANKRFDTINPTSRSFVSLPRSFNRKGGAQFTYSFWMYLGDATSSNVQDKDILVRGDIRKYGYKVTKADSTVVDNGTDVLIKCPRIRFGKTFDELVVEFNTLDEVSHQVHLMASKTQPGDESSLRHNVMGMIRNKWVLLTFVFEDNVAINDFEDGTVMRFYVNDMLYYTHSVRSTLRQNDSDLFLFPFGEVKGCRLANLAYYNYALGANDVRALYNAGRPSHYAKNVFDRDTLGDPLYLSEYNKLDIYNA